MAGQTGQTGQTSQLANYSLVYLGVWEIGRLVV